MSGHLSEASPIKISKDRWRKYFNSPIQNDETLHQGVYFSLKKHWLFSDIVKDKC